jgi:RalA-binding protein 1
MERQTRPVLTSPLLPFAQIRVVSSSLRITERHKELVSFRIAISLASAPASELEAAAAAAPTPSSSSSSMSDTQRPGAVPTNWRVEKSWIDLQALDAQVRSKANRQESKGLSGLPDKSLFKDHAPQRSDQRKVGFRTFRLFTWSCSVLIVLITAAAVVTELDRAVPPSADDRLAPRQGRHPNLPD